MSASRKHRLHTVKRRSTLRHRLFQAENNLTDPLINLKRAQLVLKSVMRGDYHGAERLLEKLKAIDPSTSFVTISAPGTEEHTKKANVTREWIGISPIQFAAWAGDLTHDDNGKGILNLLLRYVTKEDKPEALEQLQSVQEGGTEYGFCFEPYKRLLKSIGEYANAYDSTNYVYQDYVWNFIVGRTQKGLPMVGIQEYCDPTPFAPIPTFEKAPQRSYMLLGSTISLSQYEDTIAPLALRRLELLAEKQTLLEMRETEGYWGLDWEEIQLAESAVRKVFKNQRKEHKGDALSLEEIERELKKWLPDINNPSSDSDPYSYVEDNAFDMLAYTRMKIAKGEYGLAKGENPGAVIYEGGVKMVREGVASDALAFTHFIEVKRKALLHLTEKLAQEIEAKPTYQP